MNDGMKPSETKTESEVSRREFGALSLAVWRRWQPDAKDKLKSAFAAANVPAEIEVYPGTQHGWCVPDMPLQNGMPIYNMPDAERAWGKLVSLYKTALA